MSVTEILLSENLNFDGFYKFLSLGLKDGKKEEYEKGFQDGYMVRDDVERFFEEVLNDSQVTIAKTDRLLASKMNPVMLAKEFAQYFYEKGIKISKVSFKSHANEWSLRQTLPRRKVIKALCGTESVGSCIAELTLIFSL